MLSMIKRDDAGPLGIPFALLVASAILVLPCIVMGIPSIPGGLLMEYLSGGDYMDMKYTMLNHPMSYIYSATIGTALIGGVCGGVAGLFDPEGGVIEGTGRGLLRGAEVGLATACSLELGFISAFIITQGKFEMYSAYKLSNMRTALPALLMPAGAFAGLNNVLEKNPKLRKLKASVEATRAVQTIRPAIQKNIDRVASVQSAFTEARDDLKRSIEIRETRCKAALAPVYARVSVEVAPIVERARSALRPSRHSRTPALAQNKL